MWVLLIIESPVEKIQFFIKEFEKMRNRWIMCPFCKGKTRIKIREDTELKKLSSLLSEMQTGNID